MSQNPYQPPQPGRDVPVAVAAPVERGPFVLAAVGAWLASAYWAALTLLLGVGIAVGSVSGVQVILPCVLIALYAWRGVQLFRGDPAAARRLMWLHGFGGVAALMQIASGGGGFIVVLQGLKIAIHVFGGVTSYMALRAAQR
jgi:hypothetical protein